MALINCPECKKEVSDQSITCPNCGFPIKSQFMVTPPPLPLVNENHNKVQKEGKYNKSFIINIILVIVGSWLVYSFLTSSFFDSSSSNVSETVNANAPIDIETTASRMINTYEDNEVRADAIYKDKKVKVTGIVSSISSDITDKAVVSLAPKGNEYAIISVMASGDSNFHNQAIQLKKGQKVTLICIGSGEIIGSPSLSNCSFS